MHGGRHDPAPERAAAALGDRQGSDLAAMLLTSSDACDRERRAAPAASALVHYLTTLEHPPERRRLLEVLLVKSLHRTQRGQVLASHAHVCAVLGVDQIRLLPGLLPAAQPCAGVRFEPARTSAEDESHGGALFFALGRHAPLDGSLTTGRCLVHLARLGLVRVRAAAAGVPAELTESAVVQSWLSQRESSSMTMTALELVVTRYGRGFLDACAIEQAADGSCGNRRVRPDTGLARSD